MKPLVLITFRGVASNLARFFLTFVPIAMGVGFAAGSVMFANGFEAGFQQLIQSERPPPDGQVLVDDTGFGVISSEFSEGIADDLDALPEVADVSPSVASKPHSQFTFFKDGVSLGSPHIISWNGSDLGGFELVEGTKPDGNEQIVFDSAYAEQVGVEIGDVLNLEGEALSRVEVAGLITMVEGEGAVQHDGVLELVYLDVDSVQTLYGKPDIIDNLFLRKADGVSEEEFLSAVEAHLPAGLIVKDRAEIVGEQDAYIAEIATLYRNTLLVFAAIAIFVSTFGIYNTFAIIAARRVQETGLLRSVGATRRQVAGIVIGEAMVVGAVGSAAGLLLGSAIAFLLQTGYASFTGIEIQGLAWGAGVVSMSFGIGVGVSVLAAAVPSFRSANVSPVEVMANNRKTPESERPKRAFARVAVACVGISFSMLALWLRSHVVEIGSVRTDQPAVYGAMLAIGLVVSLVGIVWSISVIAGKASQALRKQGLLGLALSAAGGLLVTQAILEIKHASLISSMPKAVIGLTAIAVGLGLAGSNFWRGPRIPRAPVQLAETNTARNPQRTATSAGAVTIAVALICAVLVGGESLKSSSGNSLESLLRGDVLVADQELYRPMGLEAVNSLRGANGVSALTEIRVNEARFDDATVSTAAYDSTTATALLDFDLVDGSSKTLSGGGIWLHADYASDEGTTQGDQLSLQWPGQEPQQVTVHGLFRNRSLFDSDVVVDLEFYEQFALAEDTQYVVASGENSEVLRTNLDQALEEYQGLGAVTVENYVEDQQGALSSLVQIVNYLLGLSLVVAFVGVINSMMLSVSERRKEVGLLRSIGATRKQIRRMFLLEGLVVCMLGAVSGTILGVGFASAGVFLLSISPGAFPPIPFGSVLLTAVAATLVGVGAGIIPGWSAARKPVLETAK